MMKNKKLIKRLDMLRSGLTLVGALIALVGARLGWVYFVVGLIILIAVTLTPDPELWAMRRKKGKK